MVAKEMEQKGFKSRQEEDFDMRASLQKIEKENVILKAQAERDREEIESLRKSIQLLSESNTKVKRTDLKEREHMIKRLNNKVESM